MANPRLTFCIPTHDGRGPFLHEVLHSIFTQIEDVPPGCLTVSISDNASQDSTQEVVADFQARFPGLIRYSRHEVNQGFLPNMLQALGEAPGDYGWLFSSDDCVAPGGVKRVWEALRDHPGLGGMTVDFQPYDSTLTHPRPGIDHRVYPADWEKTHLYSSLEDAFGECASLMGYFSGQIMSLPLWREARDAIGLDALRRAGYFCYVYLNGEILRRQPRWLWLGGPVVQNRTDNDSVTREMNRNLMRYQTAVLNDMTWVWGKVLGRHSRTFRRLVRVNAGAVWSWRSLCSYKVSACTRRDEAQAVIDWTRVLYFLPAYWLSTFLVLLIPRSVLRLAVLPAARRLNLAAPEASVPMEEA